MEEMPTTEFLYTDIRGEYSMFDFGKITGDNQCHQITERLSKKYISEQCVKTTLHLQEADGKRL